MPDAVAEEDRDTQNTHQTNSNSVRVPSVRAQLFQRHSSVFPQSDSSSESHVKFVFRVIGC